MINYLLLLQFPLLYCISVVLGLVVYGSDFDRWDNALYFVPLLAMPALWGLLWRQATQLSGRWPSLIIVGGLAIVALHVGRSLHFSWWDEHSAAQAAWVSLSGVLSCLASLIAARRLAVSQSNHAAALSWALLATGAAWLLAFYYPMSGFVVIALIAMLACFEAPDMSCKPPRIQKPRLAFRYLPFVLMLDISLVIWDYQVDTSWAWHLALALIAAAFGSRLAFIGKDRSAALPSAVVAVAIATFLAGIVWPAFVISPLHSILAGIGLGLAIAWLLHGGEAPNPALAGSLAIAVITGMAFGHLIYAHLSHAAWRWIFLLPLLALLAWPLAVAGKLRRLRLVLWNLFRF